MTFTASWSVLLPTVCSGFDESPFRQEEGEALLMGDDPSQVRDYLLRHLQGLFKEEPASIAILIQTNQTP